MDELTKARLDYGWKYFDFHARQRTLMLNFFLIVIGILANAYVTVFKEGFAFVASAVSGLGFVGSIAFLLLERRNRVLVNMGEDVLRKLETEFLFPDDYKGKSKKGDVISLGFISREAAERGKEKQCGQLIKHRHIIPLLEGTIAVFFLVGIVYPHWKIEGRSACHVQQSPSQTEQGQPKSPK
jgi:hypothetical protein